MKKMLIFIFLLLFLNGCASNQENTENLATGDAIEENESEESQKLEEESGTEYEYNYDSVSIKSTMKEYNRVEVSILCGNDDFSFGEKCFSQILELLDENFNNFSISYGETGDFYLYLVVDGEVISDDIPHCHSVTLSEDEVNEIDNFLNEFSDFLCDNENGKSETLKEKPETEEYASNTLIVSVFGKYAVNNLIQNYNLIAECPIDSEIISDMEELDRPVSKINITISNGVYVIAQYNEYSERLFVDYQEEANDDLSIYPVFRDFVKATKSSITDEDIETGWSELQSGNYQHYTEYDMCGIKCTYSIQNLRDGQKRYYIKTYCEL